MELLTDRFSLFENNYQGKRILVTGHTGFKGSWLTLWLLQLGADVAGFSLYNPSSPCAFEILELEKIVTHFKGDIRDFEQLKKVFQTFKPEVVFHLAAQSLVRLSYDEPKRTFDTNVGGTVNVLECIKETKSTEVGIIITSDKCYSNNEWEFGYRENDRLGGEDPYSASKGCAELVFYGYVKSFFSDSEGVKLASARAGNVIGGGDWAKDRIIPDCVRFMAQGKTPMIRNPYATRPWQHVLEPLSGYLLLGHYLLNDKERVNGESFNFGPDSSVIKPVGELVQNFLQYSDIKDWQWSKDKGIEKESNLLKLCCDKALHRLGWQPVLNFNETVEFTSKWYSEYTQNIKNMYAFSCDQLALYFKKAVTKKCGWVKERTL